MGEFFFGKVLPTNLFKLQPDVQWLTDWLHRFIAQMSCNIWLLTRHRCPCKRTIILQHGLRQKDTSWLKPSWSEWITLLIRTSLLLSPVCRLNWGGAYVVLENLKQYNSKQISKTDIFQEFSLNGILYWASSKRASRISHFQNVYGVT